MRQAKQLRNAQRLRVRPGDLIVVSVDSYLDQNTAERMKRHMESAIPKGVKCIVLGKGVSLSVLGV